MSPLPSVGLLSLGCPKNLVDSERILGRLGEEGFPVALSADLADVLIINTCAFIEPAVEESEEAIAECLEFKSRGQVSKVVILGCLPLRDPTHPLLETVDAVFGIGELDRLAAYLRDGEIQPGGPRLIPPGMEGARFRLGPGHVAYLRITEGCDNRCAYCTIPGIRGPLVRKQREELLAESKELVSGGVRELILIGQDTAAWGTDSESLPGLVDDLSALTRLRWIRLLYLHPAHFPLDLLSRAEEGPLLPYFDLPIQHSDDRVLREMNRRVRQSDLEDLFGSIRKALPHVVLRTTVMVGFPGETTEAVRTLMGFLEKVRFERLGVFPYSPEKGTPAAERKDQVGAEETHRRLRAVQTLAARIMAEIQEDQIGRTVEAVVDGEWSEGVFAARSVREAFEIDPVILIRKKRLSPGQRGQVKITKIHGEDLVGRWMKTL